jgi:hypothetical protein
LAGPNPAQPSLPRAAFPRLAHAAHLARARSRSRRAFPPADRPAPPVSRNTPPARTPLFPWQAGHARQLPLSLSPVIGYRRDHRRPSLRHIPSPLLVHQPNWCLAPVPSHPVTTVCPEPSRRHHCAPSSPPRQASLVLATSPLPPPQPPIKGPPELQLSSHQLRPPLFPFPELNRASALPSPSAPVSPPSLLWWPRVQLVWLTSFTTSPRTRRTLLPHLSRP